MTPEEAAQARRETCRRDVLAHLAIRNAVAFRASAIRERVNRDFTCDYTVEEIAAALTFLEGLGDVAQARERLGAEKFFRATSEGVLNYERNQ